MVDNIDPGRVVDLGDSVRDQEVALGWTRHIPAVLGLALLLALLGVGAIQQGERDPLPAGSGPLTGELAPDFMLVGFDGRVVRLSDYRGKPVVLNFWASWCAPCREEAPSLAKVAATAEDQVAFIGIDVRDREEDAREFIAAFALRYPNAPDTEGVEQQYGIVGIPTTIFIAGNGTVVRTWLGPLEEQRLIAFVEELD